MNEPNEPNEPYYRARQHSRQDLPPWLGIALVIWWIWVDLVLVGMVIFFAIRWSMMLWRAIS